VAWNAQMLVAKAAGNWRDSQIEVPPLSSFGPGSLEVNDVKGSVTKLLGRHMDINARGVGWDMDSGMERAIV